MRPSIVFIESNTTGTGSMMLEATAQLGFEPILLASNPARYRLSGAETVQSLDTSRREAIIGWCQAQPHGKVCGVTSSSEYFIETAANVAEHLGLRSPGSQAICAFRNKHAQRMQLSMAGLRCPRFVHLRPGSDVHRSLENLAFPVVVKPCFGSGSVGVQLCSDLRHALQHAQELLACPDNERGIVQPREVLVEEFLSGDEYSIEVVALRVIGITRKHLGSPPYFVEVGHDFPAPLQARDERTLADTALAALRALELNAGPVHVEAKLDDGVATIIEVNPRLAGGFIPELVRLATGIDLLKAVVEWVAGHEPNLTPTKTLASSIRFCLSPKAGTLRGIEGQDAAARAHGIHEVRTYKSVGDPLKLYGDFRDRLAHVIAVGPTVTETAAAAQEAHALLRVDVADQCTSLSSGSI